MVHVVFAAIVPFEKEIDPAPAIGVNVGVPQPEVENVAGVATTIAAGEVGNVSLKFTPVMLLVVVFGIVIVSVEFCPGLIVLGTNDLLI